MRPAHALLPTMLAISLSLSFSLPHLAIGAIDPPVDEINATGVVVSTSSVSIRCEVSSSGGNSPTVSKIHTEEGGMVREGDVLFTLESNHLEEAIDEGKIQVQQATAEMMKSRIQIQAAEAALVEFVEGTAQVQQKQLELEMLDAEGALVSADADLETLQEVGASKSQIQAAEFNVKRAEVNLALAKSKMDVFQRFTKSRTTTELEGQVEGARAELAAAEIHLQSQRLKLDRAMVELERSVVKAPQAGMIQFSRLTAGRGRTQVIVREGTQVREGQVLMRIIDPTKLGVVVQVKEADVELIKPGQKAEIKIDAYPDETFEGEVTSVKSFANPTSWTRDETRAYDVEIVLSESKHALKPGMTAQAKIVTD